MCLISEKSANIKSQVGYAVVQKIYYHNKIPNYAPLYITDSKYRYLLNTKYQALILTLPTQTVAHDAYRTIKISDKHAGFYGFTTLCAAKKLINISRGCSICRIGSPVIVKCQFENIFKIGRVKVGLTHYYSAFRAKYRTILEEIKE